MPRLDEVFNTKELINYYSERQMPAMLGESLFPNRKIQDIEFDMILGRGGLPVSASVHALDTETQIASREAIQKGAQGLALIKRQIPITEKDIIKINNPRTDAELEMVVSQLYNDSEKMVEGVRVRAEAMRMELLSSGKIKIEENGVKVTIDYKVPSGNKKTFDWSNAETSKPLEDLETLASAVEDASGSRPSRMLTSRKNKNALCKNVSIREAYHGVNAAKILTLTQLNSLLSDLQLPTLVTYEAKYKIEGAKGYETKRYFPENVVSMFSDGDIGESIWGLTAEEVALIGSGQMETASMVGNIFVGTYTKVDPVSEWTKAAATMMPSCPYADEIGIGTITLA